MNLERAASICQDLRYGARSLLRNPALAAVAVLSLSLAIAAGTAVFSVVHAVLLRALPYKEPDRIAVLWVTNTLNGARENNASVPNFEDWRKRSRTLEEMASYREADASFTIDGRPDWIEFAWVHGDFFRLMGRNPQLGRVFAGDDPGSREVVLSDHLWRSRFGASLAAIGRTITLSGIDFQIAGIMPKDFAFPSNDVQLWAPATALPNWQSRRAARAGVGPVIARLRPGIKLAQAAAEMEVINRQLTAEHPVENENHGVRLVPLAAQIHGKTVPFMLAVLSAAVLLVLLIACANAANLLLARGAVRRHEIALRTALGADRSRIARQLITESLLLSAIAGALSLPLASWSIAGLLAIAPHGIARLEDARISPAVLLFSLGLSLATGVLFGFAPALHISKGVGNVRQTSGVDSRGMRRVFVVAQVALAVVLLTGAGLLIRSLVALQSVDPGFHPSRVLAATLRFRNTLPHDQRAALYREVLARIGELPGVSAAGAISTMFYLGDESKFGLRAVEGKPPESRAQWTPMTWSTISGDYFQALGIPLVRGRFFNDRDTKDATPVVIINETMSRRYWPSEDPIGKGLKGFDPRGRNDEWVRVVGVVKDMRSRGLEHQPMAQIYEAQAQSRDETENLVIRGQLSADLLRQTIRSTDPTAVLSDVNTLSDRIRQQSAPRRFETLLLSLFAAIALTLAAAGIYAVMHYSVTQRTREIGIRIAIGARQADVVRMVLQEGLALVAAGIALGLTGSLALTRSIRTLLFEVAPSDPSTLALVSLVLAATAIFASYFPARGATRVDPMLTIRSE